MKKFLFLCFFFSSSFGLYAQTCQNCGVNQATPQSSLHVTGCGSTNATSAFQVTNSSGKSMFFVQDDQKVGIGTKSLTYKLELSDTNTTSGTLDMFRMYNRYSVTANNGAQMLFSANRTTSGITNVAGISGLITDINATTYKGALVFSTANSAAPAERMRIDNVGNVGIGTSSPGNKLSVFGPIAWGAASESSTLTNDQGGSIELGGTGTLANPVTSGTPFLDFHFGVGSAQDYNTRIINSANNRLDFVTNSGGVIMTINAGNAGIGTTTPASKLEVVTDDPTNNNLTAVSRFGHSTSGTPAVGIGTVVALMAENSVGALAMGADFGTVLTNVTSGSTTGDFIVRTVTNTIASEKLRVTSAGKLGIGTATPFSALHAEVSNTTYNAPTTILTLSKNGDVNASNTTDGAGAQIAFRGEDKDGNQFDVGYISAPVIDPDYNGIGRSGNLVFSTLNNWTGANLPVERMRIDNAGNVGIGTFPNFKFDVNGAGSAGEISNFQNGTYQTIIVSKASGAGVYNPITAANDNGIFWKDDGTIESGNGFVIAPWSASSTGIRIAGNGNVGIGTATPTSILAFGGNSARAVQMERHTTANTAGNNLSLIAGGATSGATDKIGGDLILSSGTATGTGSSNIQFQAVTAGTTGTTDRISATKMTLLGNGNLGIGTTTPVTNARLAIKDGHVQIQQTTAPTVGISTYTTSLSNATDAAGNINITATAVAGSATFLFNKSYTVAPIVVLTPTASLSATDIAKTYVTSTTNGFTVNFSAAPGAGDHTFSYLVIETQ